MMAVRKPEAPLLLVLLLISSSSSFLHPATSICVPRTSIYPAHFPNTTAQPTASPPFASFSAQYDSVALPPESLQPSPAPSDSAEDYFSFSSPAASPEFEPADLPSSGIFAVIDELCNHTDYRKLCVSSVLPFLSASGSIDAVALLKLQLKALRSKIEFARSKTVKLMADPEMDSESLKVCLDQNDDQFDLLDESEKSLEGQDRGTLNTKLSAVISDCGACEMNFDDTDEDFPLDAECDVIGNIADNCLALVDLAIPGDSPSP